MSSRGIVRLFGRCRNTELSASSFAGNGTQGGHSCHLGTQEPKIFSIKMNLLEQIINELESASDPLLLQILDFIQDKKGHSNTVISSDFNNSPRTPGLHQGEIWMSENFNDPLPDEFWLGEEE